MSDFSPLEKQIGNTPIAKLNFDIIGKRKKYYNHPQEDALIMKLDLVGLR